MGLPHCDIAQAGGFIAPPRYSRHRPESTLLYRLVAEHYPKFRDRRAAEDLPLPRYVEHEFEAYLKCGRLEHGFLRVKCESCQAEKPVAFSCKRRGFCPSCGGRRMAETAALLVDNVLPRQPIRQWVLSLPFALRYLLATRPAVVTQVARYRLSGDLGPSDPQGRPDPCECRDRGRDPDPALRQRAQSQCALSPARAGRRISAGRRGTPAVRASEGPEPGSCAAR
jgi:ribosomal protein S27E